MSSFCLYCESPIKETVTWRGLFYSEPQFLCAECQKGLQRIEGQRCSHCSRSLEKLPDELKNDEVCRDCFRWEVDSNWQSILQQNTSLFEYNDFLKDYLARYKYRGDYSLAKAFGPQLANHLKPLQYDHIIPIPLSEERHYERGFNQSAALLEEAQVTPSHLLSRSHSEKQSKKSRRDRMQQKQIFSLTSTNLTGKSILLFDDIYTTGTTLRQAAKLLKEAGAERVTSLTLARG
jgi:competence protein ComFC